MALPRWTACRSWPHALHPDRWMLWLGVLFILSIYWFPVGIVGRLRLRAWLAARSLH